MNGNYELAGYLAKDRQSTFISEARQHRLARQAGSQGGVRSLVVSAAQKGAWLVRLGRRAAQQAANRAAGQSSTWEVVSRRAGAARHS